MDLFEWKFRAIIDELMILMQETSENKELKGLCEQINKITNRYNK